MRKIGELKGKPIVEGNPNEVKNNQIHAKTEGENITLSERKNGSLETISGGSSNNSNFEYWYVKYVPESPMTQGGINTPVYFKRGVARYHYLDSAVGRKKCTIWPTLGNKNYGMHAIEVLPIPVTVEQDGMTFNIDATSYDNWILSCAKINIDVYPDLFPEGNIEEVINLLKQQNVEISKEEFEEIYNDAED